MSFSLSNWLNRYLDLFVQRINRSSKLIALSYRLLCPVESILRASLYRKRDKRAPLKVGSGWTM